MPCIFDDGDLHEQKPKVLKAFLDPSLAQAMTRERWGGNKFIRGQARLGADNSYDEQAEPTDADWRDACGLPLAKAAAMKEAFFLDMLKPAFPHGISKANIGAILKRCSIVLNTKNYVYVRLCGIESTVERMPLAGPYITKFAGKSLHKWVRSNIPRNPEEFDSLLHQESALMDQWMVSKQDVQSDGEEAADGPAPPPPQLSAPSSSSSTAAIFKNLRPAKRVTVIDLGTPSPKKPKTGSHSANALDDAEHDPMQDICDGDFEWLETRDLDHP